jgi:hypothetical protein
VLDSGASDPLRDSLSLPATSRISPGRLFEQDLGCPSAWICWATVVGWVLFGACLLA